MSFVIDTYGMPTDAELRMPGCVGASRYVSHDASKTVTRAQVEHIHGLGRMVDLNFEDAATNAQGGQRQGVTDGRFFVGEAKVLHAPAGVAGYASVDYEVHDGDALTTAEDYFRGWTPVLHAAGYLSGAYGDYDLLAALLRLKLIDLAWQTVAWSYGKRLRDPRACLLQDQFTRGYDVDEITAGFYGAWTPTGPQHHPSSTAPATAPSSPSRKRETEMIVVQIDQATVPKGVKDAPHGWFTFDGSKLQYIEQPVAGVNNGANILKALGETQPVPITYSQYQLWAG